MKILSVVITVSGVAENDSIDSISGIVQVHPAFCKDSFNSGAGVCRSSVASCSFLLVGG